MEYRQNTDRIQLETDGIQTDYRQNTDGIQTEYRQNTKEYF